MNMDSDNDNNRKWIRVGEWVYRERVKLYEIGTKIQFNIHKVAMHISISLLEFRHRTSKEQRAREQ